MDERSVLDKRQIKGCKLYRNTPALFLNERILKTKTLEWRKKYKARMDIRRNHTT